MHGMSTPPPVTRRAPSRQHIHRDVRRFMVMRLLWPCMISSSPPSPDPTLKTSLLYTNTRYLVYIHAGGETTPSPESRVKNAFSVYHNRTDIRFPLDDLHLLGKLDR